MESLAKISWLEQLCNVLINHLTLMNKHAKLRNSFDIDVDSIWRTIDDKNDKLVKNAYF